MNALFVFLCLLPLAAQQQPAPRIEQSHVRGELEFLASDALRGRGSATHDELVAAVYIASKLREFGAQPAGDPDDAGLKTYLQRVRLQERSFAAPPALNAGGQQFRHGSQIAVLLGRVPVLRAPLQKLAPEAPVRKGAAVLVQLTEGPNSAPVRQQITAPLSQGAAMVLVAHSAQMKQRFEAAAAKLPELPVMVGDRESSGGSVIVLLGPEATGALKALPDGADIELAGEVKKGEVRTSHNVIGKIPGTGPKAETEAIMLSAHFDGQGVRPEMKGDNIFNSADDDASGVVAVLELARAIGAAAPPRRSVYFVLFGSEELGLRGAEYFLEHPPLPLRDIAANLEFEMIGRPDPAVAADTLWLTGWERSNLGPELAMQGARLVADPHPEQQFFMRSDNYQLARRGVVAQTISSFGLHRDYHGPDDEADKIDYEHMTRAIQSLVGPVLWLIHSDFVPQWVEGKKP